MGAAAARQIPCRQIGADALVEDALQVGLDVFVVQPGFGARPRRWSPMSWRG